MRLNFVLALALCIGFVISNISEAQARYRYTAPGCEFRITFPEAPWVETIWPDQPIPIWEVSRGLGEVGEKAFFQRKNPDNEAEINFEVICVKAQNDLIQNYDKSIMFTSLRELYSAYDFGAPRMDFTEDIDRGIKWATYSGFSQNENRDDVITAGHFITGQQSIMIIKSQIVGTDEFFEQEFNDIMHSITINTSHKKR